MSPATTMLSLLARRIVLPVFAAEMVVSSPAKPEIAEIIMSMSSLIIKFCNSFLPKII